MNEPTSTILEFISHELLGDSAGRIEPDTPLFRDGLIDSLKILQLIAFIEIKTGRTIPDREVVMEHFRTVRNIEQRFFHAQALANV
jgi:acyl carrier protein